MFCKFCRDKGCVACAGERQRYEAKITEKIKNWQPPDTKSFETVSAVLLAAVRNGSMSGEDAIKELYSLLMPPPLFVAKSSADLELLKQFASREKIIELIDETGSMDIEKFMGRAEAAREQQRISEEK